MNSSQFFFSFFLACGAAGRLHYQRFELLLLRALEAGKKHGIGLGSAAATSFEGWERTVGSAGLGRGTGVLALYAAVGGEGGLGWGFCM